MESVNKVFLVGNVGQEGEKGLGEVGVDRDSRGSLEALEGRGGVLAGREPTSLPLARSLPPVLVGHETGAVEKAARQFYLSVDAMFDAWLRRTENGNTQRAYRRDVLDFVEFMAIPWPEESWRLLKVGVPDVQAWRDAMQHERNLAPKTLNRRISSLSGFFTFMRETAAAARLPIVVPNPAHSQFIGRESKDPIQPTQALSAPRARQLMALPEGESVLAYRDRAILKFYLYTGARIGTACRLQVADFHQDHEDATLKIQEKGRGRSKRAIGIHFALAEAIQEYLDHAGITSGPLFRPRVNARSQKLADRPMDVATMYRLIQGYLERLPGAMKEVELPDGTAAKQCVYTPHSLRAHGRDPPARRRRQHHRRPGPPGTQARQRDPDVRQAKAGDEAERESPGAAVDRMHPCRLPRPLGVGRRRESCGGS